MSLSHQLPGFPVPPSGPTPATKLEARIAAARATLHVRALAVSARSSGGFAAPFAEDSQHPGRGPQAGRGGFAGWQAAVGAAGLANPSAFGIKPVVRAWRPGTATLTISVGTGFVTFAQGAATAAGLSLLVLALTLVLSARSREMTLARLATMGLRSAQSRRITIVETLPAILAATMGGAACALALVPLVGPSVNLAAFTGMPVVVPLHANLMAIAATAAGLIVLAWVTLAVQSRLARGRGTTQALRVGE